MSKTFKLSIVALVAAFAADVASASVFCDTLKNKGLISKRAECKLARSTDKAEAYALEKNGDFFRFIVKANRPIVKCQITASVQDFKVSGHSKDVAVAYYIKASNLHYLINQGTMSGQCPKVESKKLLENVKYEDSKYRYTVVSNSSRSDDSNDVIVNLALNTSGSLYAWKNFGSPTVVENVREFKMNSCYGSAGKAFSNFVAYGTKFWTGEGFALRQNGNVTTFSNRYYGNIAELETVQNVCK